MNLPYFILFKIFDFCDISDFQNLSVLNKYIHFYIHSKSTIVFDTEILSIDDLFLYHHTSKISIHILLCIIFRKSINTHQHVNIFSLIKILAYYGISDIIFILINKHKIQIKKLQGYIILRASSCSSNLELFKSFWHFHYKPLVPFLIANCILYKRLHNQVLQILIACGYHFIKIIIP